MKRNEKLSKRNQKKKEFKDKDIHLNVVGIPEKNVNVKKTSPGPPKDYDVFKISIDTENRRPLKSELGPSPNKTKTPTDERPSLVSSISNNNTFSSTDSPQANTRVSSNSSSGVCYTGEDRKNLTIISKNPAEHQLMAKKLQREERSRQETSSKQVIFNDEDAVYGTPPHSAFESEESLNNPYRRTTPQVYKVEDPTAESVFKSNHHKMQVIPKGTYLGGEDEASVISKLSKLSSGSQKIGHRVKYEINGVPPVGSAVLSYPSTSKAGYPTDAQKEKDGISGLADFKKSKLSSIDELGSVDEDNPEQVDSIKPKEISALERAYPPPIMTFEKLSKKSSYKKGVESDSIVKPTHRLDSFTKSILPANSENLSRINTDSKTDQGERPKSDISSENKLKTEKINSTLKDGKNPILVDRESMTDSIIMSNESVIGPKHKVTTSSTTKQSKDSSNLKSSESAQRPTSNKSKISTIVSSIPKPSFMKSPRSVRKPVIDTHTSDKFPSKKSFQGQEAVNLEGGLTTSPINETIVDKNGYAKDFRQPLTQTNQKHTNSVDRPKADASTSILSFDTPSKNDLPRRFLPKSVSDDISFEIANRSFGVSSSTEIQLSSKEIPMADSMNVSETPSKIIVESETSRDPSTPLTRLPEDLEQPVDEQLNKKVKHMVENTVHRDEQQPNKYIDDLFERLNMNQFLDEENNNTKSINLEEAELDFKRGTPTFSAKNNSLTQQRESSGKNKNMFDNFGVLVYPGDVKNENPFGYSSQLPNSDSTNKYQEEPGSSNKYLDHEDELNQTQVLDEFNQNIPLQITINPKLSTQAENQTRKDPSGSTIEKVLTKDEGRDEHDKRHRQKRSNSTEKNIFDDIEVKDYQGNFKNETSFGYNSQFDKNKPLGQEQESHNKKVKRLTKRNYKTKPLKTTNKQLLQNNVPDQQVFLGQIPANTYDIFYNKNDQNQLPTNTTKPVETEYLQSKGPKGILIFVNKKTTTGKGLFDSFASHESGSYIAPSQIERKDLDEKYSQDKEKQHVAHLPYGKVNHEKGRGVSPKDTSGKDNGESFPPYGQDMYDPEGKNNFGPSSPYQGKPGESTSPPYAKGKPGGFSPYGKYTAPPYREDKSRPGSPYREDKRQPASPYRDDKHQFAPPYDRDRPGAASKQGRYRYDPIAGQTQYGPAYPYRQGVDAQPYKEDQHYHPMMYGQNQPKPTSPYDKSKRGKYGDDESPEYGRGKLGPSSPRGKGKVGEERGYGRNLDGSSPGFEKGKFGPSSSYEKGTQGDYSAYGPDEQAGIGPSSGPGKGRFSPPPPYGKSKLRDEKGYGKYEPSSGHGKGKFGSSYPHKKGEQGDETGYEKEGYNPSSGYGKGKFGHSHPYKKAKKGEEMGYEKYGYDPSSGYKKGKFGHSSPYEKDMQRDDMAYERDGVGLSSGPAGKDGLRPSSPYSKDKQGEERQVRNMGYDPASGYGKGQFGPSSPYKKRKHGDNTGYERDGYEPASGFRLGPSSPYGNEVKQGYGRGYGREVYDSPGYGKNKLGPSSPHEKGKQKGTDTEYGKNRYDPYSGHGKIRLGASSPYSKGEAGDKKRGYGIDAFDPVSAHARDRPPYEKGKERKTGLQSFYGRDEHVPSAHYGKGSPESTFSGKDKFGDIPTERDIYGKSKETKLSHDTRDGKETPYDTYGKSPGVSETHGKSGKDDYFDYGKGKRHDGEEILSDDKYRTDDRKYDYSGGKHDDMKLGKDILTPSRNIDKHGYELGPLERGRLYDSSREEKDQHEDYGREKTGRENDQEGKYAKPQRESKPIQARNIFDGSPQRVPSEYLLDSASLEGGEGRQDKTVDVERSPSGARITQNHPCGCKTTTYSGPGSELKGEEIMSAFCKEGSKCEIANGELRTGGRRISVYKTSEPSGDSQYDQAYSAYSLEGRSFDKPLKGHRSIPEIEVVANGMISKKKIKPRPPAPTMNGVKYSGSLKIKSNKLNGVCNIYLDPRLKSYLRNNMHKLEGLLEDDDVGYND